MQQAHDSIDRLVPPAVRPERLSPAAMFASALADHRAGDLDAAARCYRQVLAADPRHADALHLLGVVATQTGRPDEAIALIREAIACNGRAACFHSSLGSALLAQGRAEAAIASFRKALTLDPKFVEAHVNLGNALLQAGLLDEAIRCFASALRLNPGVAQAHNSLADALRQQGRLRDAASSCERALAVAPDYPEAHLTLGAILMQQEQLDAAIGCFTRALELRPDFVAAQVNLGSALAKQKQPDAAIAWFLKAIALKPEHPDTYNNLGSALMDKGLPDEALSCFNMALALRPDYPDALLNLASTLRGQGRLDEALACAARAVTLAPGLADAHVGVGGVMRAFGRLDEAVGSFRRAIELVPDDPQTHSDLAIALLANGDLAEGWEEYEWRFRTRHMRAGYRLFDVPQWRGEAAAGQTLLIHAEQGFGDTIQFCRYARLAAARGLRVVIEVQRPLVRLLQSLEGVVQVLARGEPLPRFDLHCPMLSLPLALGTTLADIPGDTPYLRASPAQVEAWGSRLAATRDLRPRVGVLWAGNAYNQIPRLALLDRRRSIAPARLAPLLAVSGAQFFSLQKDGPPAPTDAPLVDAMHEMDDFADTAALIANLDLVVSVDSAVAHLAGALGKPVWLLDRFDPCWRWLNGRTDSPWYPGLRLYRQTRAGDWDAVVADVARNLAGLVVESER